MNAMWKEYIKERYDGESIEVDGGIMFYQVLAESIHILDIYVSAEYRHRTKFLDLMKMLNMIAVKDAAVEGITAYVQLAALNCDEILKAALYYGFSVKELDQEKITLWKGV